MKAYTENNIIYINGYDYPVSDCKTAIIFKGDEMSLHINGDGEYFVTTEENIICDSGINKSFLSK